MNKRLATITVPPDATVHRALGAIDSGGIEIAFVSDGAGRLLGTLTDGDIRRALLRGASLEDQIAPFIQRNFTFVSSSSGRAEVLDLMRARSLSQIPILDPEGRLLGVHLLREIVGSGNLPNWVVVMAGGRGERLRPLTDSIPKPMVLVAGRPILERIVLHLVGQGLREIFLAVNYMSDVVEGHFGDGQNFGCEIRYLRETSPLGTGGALSLLPETPGHPLLVLNGDLLTQFDATEMLAFHDEGGYRATVGCSEYLHTVPHGVVTLDGPRILGIREKPKVAWTVNAGIYALAPDLVERVPADTCFPLPALIEECLESGSSIGAYPIGGDWIDVGQHRELRRARGEEKHRDE